MKKLLALLMALSMVLCFAACGDKEEDKKDEDKDETTTVEDATVAGEDDSTAAGEDDTTVAGKDDTTTEKEDETTTNAEETGDLPAECVEFIEKYDEIFADLDELIKEYPEINDTETVEDIEALEIPDDAKERTLEIFNAVETMEDDIMALIADFDESVAMDFMSAFEEMMSKYEMFA